MEKYSDHNPPGETIHLDIEAVQEEQKKPKLRTVRDHLKTDESLDPSKLHILAGLQNKLVYPGTVDRETARRRRVKNKAARAARRKARK